MYFTLNNKKRTLSGVLPMVTTKKSFFRGTASLFQNLSLFQTRIANSRLTTFWPPSPQALRGRGNGEGSKKLDCFASTASRQLSFAIQASLEPQTTQPSKVQPEEKPVDEDNQNNTRIIVVTSGKGGVGKTTATANIGMSIARLGYKVVLIDADIGLKNLDLLLGLENRTLYTVIDVFEGQCRLDQALIRDIRWKNLSLLSISKSRQRYNVTRKNMQNLVKALANLNFKYILIDCPAGIDVGFINAISPAKEALIVTTSELPSIRDADRVAGLLEANGIYDIKLLINRVRSDLIQNNDMMSVRDVQEILGVPLLGAIPEDQQVIISTNRGEPLVLKKKLTLSGIAFENAARRLVGKQDYFVDLDAPYSSSLLGGVFRTFLELFKT